MGMGDRNGTSARRGRRGRGGTRGPTGCISGDRLGRVPQHDCGLDAGARRAGPRSAAAVAGDRAVQRDVGGPERSRAAGHVGDAEEARIAPHAAAWTSGSAAAIGSGTHGDSGAAAADGCGSTLGAPGTVHAEPHGTWHDSVGQAARGDGAHAGSAARARRQDVAVHRAAVGSEAGRLRAHQTRRGQAALVALAALAACSGGGGGKTAEKPQPAPIDERKAEKDAKGLVGEIVQTLGHANTDGLMALLAEPLIAFGPRRTDQMSTRTDVLVALRATFDGMGKDAKPSLKSDALSVVASPGGNSAWVADVMDIEGKPMSAMMVLSNDDDFWVVIAASVAHTPSMKTVRAELKQDAIVPPGMPGIAKVTDSAEEAVDRFKSGLADPTPWAEDLAKRSDAVVIGPSEGDVTRGKKELEKLWKKRAKVNMRHASAGEV